MRIFSYGLVLVALHIFCAPLQASGNIALRAQQRAIEQLIGTRVAFFQRGSGIWSGVIKEVTMPSVDDYIARSADGNGGWGNLRDLLPQLEVGELAVNNAKLNDSISADDTKTVRVDQLVENEQDFGAIYHQTDSESRKSKIMRLLSRYKRFNGAIIIEGIVEIEQTVSKGRPYKMYPEKIEPVLVITEEENYSKLAFIGGANDE